MEEEVRHHRTPIEYGPSKARGLWKKKKTKYFSSVKIIVCLLSKWFCCGIRNNIVVGVSEIVIVIHQIFYINYIISYNN